MEESIQTIQSNTLLIIFAVVALTGIICSKISDILKIPDIVLYLIAGIIIGPSVLEFINTSNYQVENQIILTFGSAFYTLPWRKRNKFKSIKGCKSNCIFIIKYWSFSMYAYSIKSS